MKFEQYTFAQEIKKRLHKLEFKRPTDIQYKAIPSILKGEDVLAIAQTGTGKTAAFAIPILDILHQKKRTSRADGVRCIVMVPTHELAIQISDVIKSIGHHTKVKTTCIYGGVDQEPQIKELNKGVDILVATPGRMFDLRSQGHLRLERVEILVLDEADHMLDLGFINDIRDLIRYLPRKRQTLFFSATINDKIKKLAYSLVTNPIRIQLSPKDPVAKNIDHKLIYMEMDDKRFFLERVINENPDGKILVFVRTKVRAERVKKAMERVDILTQTIHSDKDQSERVKTMADFKGEGLKVLIATDISARGIHIDNVDLVINYDLPDVAENYVHRVGRTGRGKKRGFAYSFCSPTEKEMLEEIESFMHKRITVLELHNKDLIETRLMTNDTSNDWKSLIEENEKIQAAKKKKKKRKKK